MKKLRACSLIIMVLCLFGTMVLSQEPWTFKGTFGGGNRIAGVAFTIDDKAYIGTGLEAGNTFKDDFWAYNTLTNVWTQKADFAGGERWGATGFAVSGKGYLGAGSNGNAYFSDFWAYDPATNNWSQKASFGGGGRFFSVGFAIGPKGYVGTGWGPTDYQNDFWEYSPATDSWAQKANFGGVPRYEAVGFNIGNFGYIGTGSNGQSSQNDFWKYDPATDQWTQKAPFGNGGRHRATGFSAGGQGFVGWGEDSNGMLKSDCWQYSPASDSWARKSDLPNGTSHPVSFGIGDIGYFISNSVDCYAYNPAWDNNWTQKLPSFYLQTRFYAASFAIGTKGYICTGERLNDTAKPGNTPEKSTAPPPSTLLGDLWEYNTATGAWTQKADFGGTARKMAIAFAVGTKGYLGTGEDIGGLKKDFWEYNPATNVWTQKTDFPGTPRRESLGFGIGTKGYVGTGWDGAPKSDFWQYRPSTNTWVQRAAFPFPRYGAALFTINDKAYAGFGADETSNYFYGYPSDWYEYNPTGNDWNSKGDFPEMAGLASARGFGLNGNGYLGTGNFVWGNNGHIRDFWGYNLAANTFTRLGDSGGPARTGAYAFAAGGKGYLGGGWNGALNFIDFWEFEPSCPGMVFYEDADGDGYGNPNISATFSDCLAPAGYSQANTDCNDANPAISPGQYDLWNDDLDNNCNGLEDDPLAIGLEAGTKPCFGESNGIVLLTIFGGQAPYNFLWSNSATTQNLSGVPAGTYSVTITDNQGLMALGLLVLDEQPEFALTFLGTKPSCVGDFNGSVKVTPPGSPTTFAYLWNTGSTTQTISGLAAGTYSATITKTSTGCTKSGTATLSDPPVLSVSLTTVHNKCSGESNGTITAKSTGGTGTKTFSWSNGAATAKITGLPAGSYTVTTTDTKGCMTSATSTLLTPTELVLDYILEAQPDGKFKVSLLASGGTWYPTGGNYRYCKVTATGGCAFSATSVFSNLLAGAAYTFRARDKNACTDEITLTMPSSKPGAQTRTQNWATPHADQFILRPNPFENQCVIAAGETPGADFWLLVSNVQGQLIAEKPWPAGQNIIELETSDWPQGILFCRIVNADNQTVAWFKAVKTQ